MIPNPYYKLDYTSGIREFDTYWEGAGIINLAIANSKGSDVVDFVLPVGVLNFAGQTLIHDCREAGWDMKLKYHEFSNSYKCELRKTLVRVEP